MTRTLDLRIPIIYVNPHFITQPGIAVEVTKVGGLGFIDRVTSDLCGIPTDSPYGLRIHLDAAKNLTPTKNLKAIILPLLDAGALADADKGSLNAIPLPVLVEVGCAAEARAAEAAGACALIARGAEGPGWGSETSGFVLLQEILEASGMPVYLQGGVSFRTAAGAMAAGAAGVVLDVQLALTEEAALPASMTTFFRSLGLPATGKLAEFAEHPLRVYSRIGTTAVRNLRKMEETLRPEQYAGHIERLNAALHRPIENPDTDDAILALSEDIIFAIDYAKDFKTVRAVVQEFVRRMSIRGAWPFAADSPVCRRHNSTYPIVQGPMAHVSDNPNFLAAVEQAGGLPVSALGNMPRTIAEEAVKLARDKTKGHFGVGLIGLEVNSHTYEAHLDIMRENPPPFAVLAAGGPDLAKRIEAMGTACYLHCPASGVVTEGIKAGLKRFVFEGSESGGHIGPMGSLNLWTANLAALEKAAASGVSLSDITVLFAGGIASARSSAFIAGMVADLTDKGLQVGLQMGTAYLTTNEAVSTCAITSTYQKLTLESDRTVVIGRTVNIKARGAFSPMAAELLEREHERLRIGMPLRDRKLAFEKDNLGALRLASKGCAIDPKTAMNECPVFCDITEEEQLKRGMYLMGQVVSLIDAPKSMEELHKDIILGGKALYERPVVQVKVDLAMNEHVDERTSDIPQPMPIPMETEVFHDKELIAVVGMGLRMPGSSSAEEFWNQITSGRSGIREVPEERWGKTEHFYDPDPKAPDKTYSKIGGFLVDFTFDPLKYRIPPSVARKMDLTQQMAVTCTADALTDAGLSSEHLKGRRVGIIIGNSMGGETTDLYANRVCLPRTLACMRETFDNSSLDQAGCDDFLQAFQTKFLSSLPEITEDSLPGELANVISGRVANVFNLEGPNFTVDAACASSMAAVMNAVAALRDGSIDLAISGGVDAAMHPSPFVKFSKVGALSPDGSRPFDEGANGFVMGEGCGVMVLKRLSDAVADGDKIYATIVEAGSSSDGRGKGITAPNAAGQERALKACFEQSKIDPSTVGLIEAHGTSTPVGDGTELKVLDKFFRAIGKPVHAVGIGSVKSQIGHLKAAAGAAGLIKALLSLHHKTLPPTINVKDPNHAIDWDSSPLYLLTESRPWEVNGTPRRAGVSAFGFGGTNFHMLLQEYRPDLKVVSRKSAAPHMEVLAVAPKPVWPAPPDMLVAAEAIVLGAADPAGLQKTIETFKRDLGSGAFAEVVAKYRNGAAGAQLRAAFAASDPESAIKKTAILTDAVSDPSKMALATARGIHVAQGSPVKVDKGVAFLFPGQGSQYPYMLRDLAERFPIVADTLMEADEALTALGVPTVTSSIFPDPKNSAGDPSDALRDTQLLQPMILTANTAILRLLERFNVRPVACAGHSLGEYAACVAAGVFSFRDALEAVAVRGREMARVSIADPGLMMSVPADARFVEETLALIDGYVVAANKNSPKQTVISGETAAVKKAGELFREKGLEGIILPVSAAFHSGVVAPAREPFMNTLNKLTTNAPKVPVISNVTGDYYPTDPSAPEKIRDLLGKQFAAPVEWVKTLRRFYSDGIRLFLECGPKRVMTNLTADTLASDALGLASNHPKKGGILQLMETLAILTAEGYPVRYDDAERPVVLKPELKVIQGGAQPVIKEVVREVVREVTKYAPHPLDELLDAELRETAKSNDFARYLKMQGEPVRQLIKAGYENFLKTVLPLERTVIQVRTEGMSFDPVVVSGISAGLPSEVRFPFDRESLDDLILGGNFIKKASEETRRRMLEKNVERLVKGPSGEAEIQAVSDLSGVIKLGGFFGDDEIIDEYNLDARLTRAMDITTKLAVAAGLEALRDAGIPLVRTTRTTSTGHELPNAWALPPELRSETGIIFASAFPGMASLVDEVTRQTAARFGSGAKQRLIDFYTGVVSRIKDHRERDRVTKWFSEEFNRLNPGDSEEVYTFNRDFLLKVMTMAQGQLAQLIKAQGPNTHIDAACAGTTQAVVMARDWVRTGQAKRVIIIAADDVAGKSLFPWVGSGFLAMGAATTTAAVTDAALPFDDRRHGLILGSAAVGMIVEREDLVTSRGMEPIAAIEAAVAANSGYHGTRLDVEHISDVMEKLLAKWEEQTGKRREDLAKEVFFMSHETYSPKRGGSSAAEIQALRHVFGENVKHIPIANTKGFTGHTMGVGVEDVVALRCLQKGMIPPIPNLKQPDPEFADLNLSKGGAFDAKYALRLAAGFGSQIVMTLYRAISKSENRVSDLHTHREWLRSVTNYTDPVVSVESRTLKVSERAQSFEAPAAQQTTPEPTSEIRKPAVAAQAPAAKAAEEPMRMEAVREKILALLADKTGYPPEMLDTDLDLEADLGIDTVKQAEFISEIRDTFDIARIDGLKIAEFPTIEHIINFVLEQTTGAAPAATQDPDPIAVPAGIDEAAILERIMALLSEKTGYPADMLDPDLDLEADLGIDTVKQAEFISDIRELFSIPQIDGLKIAEFPTISHIVGFVATNMPQTVSEESAAGVVAEAPAEPQQAALADVEQRILALLAEKTGYPTDMLDTDLDLEADLGIDTVKQAEFISDIRDEFNIPRIDGLKIAEFPTIKHIIQFVMDSVQAQEVTPPVQTIAEEAVPTAEPIRERVSESRLYETRLVNLPAPTAVPIPKTEQVLILGGPDDIAAALEAQLGAKGFGNIRRVETFSAITEAPAGTGIVNLIPLSDDFGTDDVFKLYLECAKRWDTGPVFMVTTVQEDGAFGFESPAADAENHGIVCGATKSFAREYPDATVKLLDLHPQLSAEEIAQAVVRSLTEAFPLETGVKPQGVLTGVRLAPSLTQADQSVIGSGDVALVTGGARGITAACMQASAGKRSLTIVIFARTALSPEAAKYADYSADDWATEKTQIIERLKTTETKITPAVVDKELSKLKAQAEVFGTMQELKQAGSEVIYRSVDIRDKAAVDMAVKEIGDLCGRVDLVIHGAGIDVSKALKSKNMDTIRAVLSVKVDGMRNLLDALEKHALPPRRIIGFGSVSGRFGNLAQVDYSAANDGLAHLLRRVEKTQDSRASIIDWAPWAEIGMAVRGSVQQTLEHAGIDFIRPDVGVELFEQELGRSQGSSEVVACGKLGPFHADAFEAPEQADIDMAFHAAGQRGKILNLTPGEYLSAAVSLDPSHPLLNDHRIDRAAVFPGVGALEVMRMAAQRLFPDQPLIGFRNVKFKSPLKVFKKDPFEAEVEVTRIESTEGTAFQGRIRSWFIDKDGRKLGDARIHHEAVILFGAPAETSPAPLPAWEQSVWITEPDIYEIFFHGPAFKFLDTLTVEGTGKGIRFQFRDTDQRGLMFSDMIGAAIETLFQAGAGFAIESRGVTALPVTLDRAVVYSTKTDPYDGELLLVSETQEGPEGRTIFRYEGVIRDAAGNRLIDLDGVEMIELASSVGLPGKIFEELLDVNAVTQAAADESFLNLTLTVDERTEYASKTVPKRAAEWLAGRAAAKKSVQRLVHAQGFQPPSGSRVPIITDENGKPSVKHSPRGQAKLDHLSISHSNGFAMAASTYPGSFQGFGVDLEKIEPRSESWAKDYFTPAEIALAAASTEPDTAFSKMWAVKEAALKAVGVGLRIDLKDVEITHMDLYGKCEVEFRNGAIPLVAEIDFRNVEARVARMGDSVVAKVMLR